MITTSLNLFDAAVIGIMLFSCLFAFFRGFVREVLSLGAWIGAAIITLYFFPTAGVKLEPYFKNPNVAAGVAALCIYVFSLVGFSFSNMLLLKFFKTGSDIGMLDNMFGLFFGAFRGAFIISLGFFLITIVMKEKEYPIWLKASITRPYVERGAIMLTKVAPDYLREISYLKQKIEDNRANYNQSDTSNKSDEPGYSQKANQRLDRLIDSMDKDK